MISHLQLILSVRLDGQYVKGEKIILVEKYLIIKSPGIKQWKSSNSINTSESGLVDKTAHAYIILCIKHKKSHRDRLQKFTTTGEVKPAFKRDESAAAQSLKESAPIVRLEKRASICHSIRVK